MRSSITSTRFRSESPLLATRPSNKLLRPGPMGYIILKSEYSKFIAKDLSITNLNSIKGKIKRFAGGRSRVIDGVNEDDLRRAQGLGLEVLKIAHIPRSWLPYQDPGAVPTAQPVLYGPRLPATACDACVERGYLCASLHPGDRCAVCAIEGLQCQPHHAVTDGDVVSIVSVPSVPLDDDAAARVLHDAVVDLAKRINRGLVKHFRRAERLRDKPDRSSRTTHLLTYEPTKAVFDEYRRFLVARRQRWARFAWMNGQVYFYGDPSLPHALTIARLMNLLQADIIRLLEKLPLLPPSQEAMLASLHPNVPRGWMLYDNLFGSASLAVQDLDGTLLEKPKTPATRRSPRAPAPAYEVDRKAMVKEPDMLLLYGVNTELTDIPMAVEVAYCNEDLDLTMRESVFWKTKANVSIAIKIDSRVKEKRQVDWSDVKQRTSIDPMITMFLVRDTKGLAEKREWRHGPVKLQVPLGRGSGVKVRPITRTGLPSYAQDSTILGRVAEAVDWEGSDTISDSKWSQTYPGFKLQQACEMVRIPFGAILRTAINRYDAYHPATDEDDWLPEQHDALGDYVHNAEIFIEPEMIRDGVLRACFAEYRASLEKQAFDKPAPKGGLLEPRTPTPMPSPEQSPRQSPRQSPQVPASPEVEPREVEERPIGLGLGLDMPL